MNNLSLYTTAIYETFFMTFVSSLLSYVIGIPLGVLLYCTDKDGLTPRPMLYNVLSLIVNIFRSIPFLILLILVLMIPLLLNTYSKLKNYICTYIFYIFVKF